MCRGKFRGVNKTGEIVTCDIRAQQAIVTIIPTTTSAKPPECWAIHKQSSSYNLVAGYSDGSVCQFDLRASNISVAQSKLTAGVCCVDMNEGKAFASTVDGSIAYFDSFDKPGHFSPTINVSKAHGDTGTVWAVKGAIYNEKQHVISTGSKGDVKLWEVKNSGILFPVSTLLVSSHAVVCMDTFASNPNVAIMSSLDKKVEAVGIY